MSERKCIFRLYMDAIKQLKSLDLQECDMLTIEKLLFSMSDVPAIKATVVEGTTIARARPGRGFSQPHQLTYRPANKCSNFQRATLLGETAFYGCLAEDQRHNENARAISVAESATLSRMGKESVGREYLTIGLWTITKPLSVISFVTDETYPKVKNRHLDMFRLEYTKRKKYYTPQQIAFSCFLNQEFSKVVNADENYKYKITAQICHDAFYVLEDNIGQHFDAIVYPSVQMGGQAGLDIAIRPDVADKVLQLSHVIETSFFKKREQSILRIDRGYDAHHHLLSGKQFGDDIVCRELHINNLHDLPIIRH